MLDASGANAGRSNGMACPLATIDRSLLVTGVLPTGIDPEIATCAPCGGVAMKLRSGLNFAERSSIAATT